MHKEIIIFIAKQEAFHAKTCTGYKEQPGLLLLVGSFSACPM